MTAKLKQISIAFSPLEDRLLLRLSTADGNTLSEYRFWMTRRFAALLQRNLDQTLEADVAIQPSVHPEGREAFRQFQQEAALAGTDFATPYRAETAKNPLGTEPLLLHGFQTTRRADGNFNILLKSTDGKSITLNLNIALIHSLRKLMIEQARVAEWDIVKDDPARPILIPAPSRTFH
jgi:hypothetical protein